MHELIYIDPGSGSYLVQVLIGALLGIVMFFKTIKMYILSFFKRFTKKQRMNEKPVALPSSYRDPAGYIFRQDGLVYRLITETGRPSYDGLMNSGLYHTLTQKNIAAAYRNAG